MIANLIGSSYSTTVASSCEVIWKPPSPQIDQTVAFGAANWAPIAAGTSKPIVPRPPEVMKPLGLSIQKYCAAHIWCWPTPVT